MSEKILSRKLNLTAVISEIADSLAPRTKDVIEKRFGLSRGEPMTLEAVGKKYGITRERVRQIEADGLNVLRQAKNLNRLVSFFGLAKSHLRNNGDFREEKAFYRELARLVSATAQQFYFSLHLGKDFDYVPDHPRYQSAWTSDAHSFKKVKKAIEGVSGELAMIRRPVVKDEMFSIAGRHLKKTAGFSLVSDAIVCSALEVAKEIAKNPFGEYGLVRWPDINPRGVRDKAHLIFKKHGKPLHFKEVAEHINRASFDARQAHPQTVHNELIKDPRFVLIGRGTYALKDWGYEQGTVKDVLMSVFKKHPRPLTKEEVVEKVMGQRMVKENTIFLNLQNKNYFQRTADGKYAARGRMIVEET